MAQQNVIDQFEQMIDECLSIPVDELVARSGLGTVNFEEVRGEVESLFDILNKYKGENISILTDQIVSTLINTLTPSFKNIMQMRQFNIDQDNHSQIRNQIVNQFRNDLPNFYNFAVPWWSYIFLNNTDIKSVFNEVSLIKTRADEAIEDIVEDLRRKEIDLEKIIVSARDAAGTVGVALYTKDFDSEAGGRETSAKWWLGATGLFAGITVAAALISFWWLPLDPEAKLALVLQHITTKVIVLGMLFSATVWSGQMFRANKHQAAINRQKANGLKTFQAFVETAGDEQIKDAVLLETTRSIFSHSSPGYINQPSTAEGSGRVVEVVRTVAEKAVSEQ